MEDQTERLFCGSGSDTDPAVLYSQCHWREECVLSLAAHLFCALCAAFRRNAWQVIPERGGIFIHFRETKRTSGLMRGNRWMHSETGCRKAVSVLRVSAVSGYDYAV